MNEHEIRTRLAEHLGIDRERVGIESGAAACSATVLGADDETYRIAAKWLRENSALGVCTTAHATILASDTHCSLCADRGISNRLRFREVRMGGFMRRYSKCPDRFCPNGKRERCALIPLGPPKKHKPKGFTGPDLGRGSLVAHCEELLTLLAVGTTHESAGAVRVPASVELLARNAGYATIDDIRAAYPVLYNSAGYDVPAESDEERRMRENDWIEVDALRVGQRWRHPENTDSWTCETGAFEYWLSLSPDYPAVAYSSMVDGGWRCIYDPPNETSQKPARGES